ncbi:hypothetical protein KIL84_007133 [Mauremys mutica]|uniref:Uncharacterized protein n=1 Tax=Mauremys mutica TaxID=74926 RepID=A0A9D3X2T2_9SAUR|nr:hypothetical protein KIL84_007133 [Mauremys mutica]
MAPSRHRTMVRSSEQAAPASMLGFAYQALLEVTNGSLMHILVRQRSPHDPLARPQHTAGGTAQHTSWHKEPRAPTLLLPLPFCSREQHHRELFSSLALVSLVSPSHYMGLSPRG